MALVGINPTDWAPRKRSPMDSILVGAQIANQVLGAAASGANIYSELFGDKADLYKSQIKKNLADSESEANTRRRKIESEIVDEFEKHDTVRAVNNLNDIYLTAKEFSKRGGISAEMKLPFVAKYMQAMNPKAGIRLNPEGTGFVTEGMEPVLASALKRWNAFLNTPEGLDASVVRGMQKAIEIQQSSLLPKLEQIIQHQEMKAATEGVKFNPITRPYGVQAIQPQIDQNVMKSIDSKLKKPR